MNQDIKNFQIAMNWLYSDGQWIPGYVRLVEDGIYGPKTREALLAFQRLHNLTPSGQYDTATADRLHYVLAMNKMAMDRRNLFESGMFQTPKGGAVAKRPEDVQSGQFLQLPNVEIKGAFTRALPWVLLAGAGYYLYSQRKGRRA